MVVRGGGGKGGMVSGGYTASQKRALRLIADIFIVASGCATPCTLLTDPRTERQVPLKDLSSRSLDRALDALEGESAAARLETMGRGSERSAHETRQIRESSDRRGFRLFRAFRGRTPLPVVQEDSDCRQAGVRDRSIPVASRVGIEPQARRDHSRTYLAGDLAPVMGHSQGVPCRRYWAAQVGTARKGPWSLSKNTTVAKALPETYFVKTLGLVLPG